MPASASEPNRSVPSSTETSPVKSVDRVSAAHHVPESVLRRLVTLPIDADADVKVPFSVHGALFVPFRISVVKVAVALENEIVLASSRPP